MGKISHCLWFDGQAEEAVKFYTSVFKNSKIGRIAYYGDEGFEIHGGKKGTVMSMEFELDGAHYLALNGGPHFKFNEAFSIVVSCETQAEVDFYWNSLTKGGGEEGPCGWLKDRFGLSWQITPIQMGAMMTDPDQKKVDRVTKAFLQMKKFDLAALQRAYEGK